MRIFDARLWVALLTVSVGGCASAPPEESCDDSEVRCGDESVGFECVKRDDPSWGCGTCEYGGCSFSNEEAVCINGSCERGQCRDGYVDCDGDESNGCEAFLPSDPLNCGECRNACSAEYPGAMEARCDEGACSVACEVGYTNEDGDLDNGCESLVPFRVLGFDWCPGWRESFRETDLNLLEIPCEERYVDCYYGTHGSGCVIGITCSGFSVWARLPADELCDGRSDGSKCNVDAECSSGNCESGVCAY